MADPRLSPGAGSATGFATEQPVFYLDFSSPECWLSAERVNQALPVVPVWQPVRAARAANEAGFDELRRRAAAQGLLPLATPATTSGDLDVALRAATFAQAAGRVVAFALAALRQAFAAGRDLSQLDNVLIAAAACELHPRAVLKGIESRATEERLRAASGEAAARGVRELPAVFTAGRVFEGPDAVERAAEAIE